MKKNSRSRNKNNPTRQEEANKLVRRFISIDHIKKIKSANTQSNDIPKVSEVYNATNSPMEIMDEKGFAVIALQPYERREINKDERCNLEKLEHFIALNKRNLVRFF